MEETKFEPWYSKNYKKLLVIPILLFALTFLILGISYSTNEEFIKKDVTLTGGISATINIEEEINTEILETQLQARFPTSDIVIRTLTDLTTSASSGLIIDISKVTNDEFQPALEEILNRNLNSNEYSVQETGSALGESFFKEMIFAILFAFILMIIVVFITFRKSIPCLAIILSAILDLTATLAIINLLGIRLSTAGIVAFLLIIGYSIDTDIMLTTRVLKRQGNNARKTLNAMKTGLTMTITTLAASIVALLVTNSLILKQMFLIITIALVIDILSTWTMNAPLLTWYTRKNEDK
tara:strand:+ start:1071 stop:1961 length:891 start_codon:yes stop_codon:yes gene_type:complete